MTQHLKPVVPITLVTEGDVLWAVAGEALRFRLEAPGITGWGAALLARIDGRPTMALLAEVPESARADAADLLDLLVGERLLYDAGAPPVAVSRRLGTVEGEGPLADALRVYASGDEADVLVLAQSDPNPSTVREFGARCLEQSRPHAFVTIGPAARALIAPLVVPPGRPCLQCLLIASRRLSPTPALHDLLERHDGPFTPVTWSPAAIGMLAGLVAEKLTAEEHAPASARMFALHVVEAGSLEVNAFELLPDPACPACR